VKKIIATAIAFLMVLSVILVGVPQVAEASPADMVVVYVNAPDDWEYPSVWAWDDGGNNVFPTWPGGEMDPDPNNPGWYYIYLPNWANNVIVNANDGEVQTDVLSTEGNNVWIIIDSSDDVEVTFESQTDGEAPEFVERITVFARVPGDWENPCVWAWLDPDGTNAFEAWPGGQMRMVGDWYSIRVASWVNSIIINANDGTVQTDDLQDWIQGRDVWVVVSDDGSAEVFNENPDQMVPNITVHALVPADWENPCLWAWSHPDGTNVFGAWPGEALTQVGDWYEISIPGWANSFIINANDGSVQTGDMSEVEIGVDIWIVVEDADNFRYYYSEPELPTVAAVDEAADEPEPDEEVEEAAEPAQETEAEEDAEEGDNVWLWIILGVVAVVVVVIIVVVVSKKKKD